MIDKNESFKSNNETKNEPRSSKPEDFLDGKQDFAKLPKNFSFEQKIIYALKSLLKWSLANYKHENGLRADVPNGHETSAVFYLNANEEFDIQELNSGTTNDVTIYSEDLSSKDVDQVYEYIQRVEKMGWPIIRIGREDDQKVILPDYLDQQFDEESPRDRRFVLLPKDFPKETVRGEKILGVKGKKLLGTIHTHPSGQPFSPGDLGNVHFCIKARYPSEGIDDDEPSYSVLTSDGTLYVLVKTKDSYNQELPYKDDVDSSLEKIHYEQEIEEKMFKFMSEGLAEKDARIRTTIDVCLQHRVALYIGHIDDNKFNRVV